MSSINFSSSTCLDCDSKNSQKAVKLLPWSVCVRKSCCSNKSDRTSPFDWLVVMICLLKLRFRSLKFCSTSLKSASNDFAVSSIKKYSSFICRSFSISSLPALISSISCSKIRFCASSWANLSEAFI